jgi:MoaA/NifB/PqqE/SkfB family radical SAM enzyme
MKIQDIIFEEGWYGEENDGRHAFRWTTQNAVCRLKGCRVPGQKLLHLVAGHSFAGESLPVLEVFANGHKIGERAIDVTFCSYIFEFEGQGDISFDLKLDRVFKVPADTRELGIMVREIRVLALEEDDDHLYGEGWYEWDLDEFFPFRWISREGRIFGPRQKLEKNKYVAFSLFSEFGNFSQKLTLRRDGTAISETPLNHKWNYYCLPVHPESAGESGRKPAGKDSVGEALELDKAKAFILTFELNKLFPEKYHGSDPRKLGARIGNVEFHNDDSLYQNFLFFHENALLNFKEMQEGKTELRSYPLNLGIDLYGKCNMKPPCVYCLWDRMKDLEGDYQDCVVDRQVLEGYGPFYKAARTLVNCSFGEPLLHPQFTEILDSFERNKKITEISTNGQAFTERTIKALVGKPVYLYISLDAARKETYAKIRNDRFDEIIPNLVRLNQERKRKGNLPKIFMVFMPMRVNKDDLEDFFRLCRMIDADSIVLRPLLYLWNPQIEADRGGYHFDYKNELLSREEIDEIIARCDELSQKYGIPVANQFNFGMIEVPGMKTKGR